MLSEPVCHGSKPIRLACLIHAASIHPELGSNSHIRFMPPIEGHESMVETEEKLALSGCHSASAERSLYWFNALVQIFKVRSETKKVGGFRSDTP